MSGGRTVRATAVSVALAASLLLSSCMLWGTDQLGVSAGKGLYVRIYQAPTDQIAFLYVYRNRDAAAVLREMEQRVVFSDDIVERIASYGYVLFDIEYFFDRTNVPDFKEALGRTMSNPTWCLMMHRNPFNYLPGADRHNWTVSVPPGECKRGKPFPITA